MPQSSSKVQPSDAPVIAGQGEKVSAERAGGMGQALLRRFRSFDHLVALFDQASMALTRLGGLLVFARIMDIESFGALALVVSITFILNNAQRSVVILPYILSCKNAGNAEDQGAAWFWIDMIVSAAVLLVLLGAWQVGALVGAPRWVDDALLYSAIGTPPLMAFTFLRRWAYQNRRYRAVLWMVLAYVVAFVATAVSAWWWRDLHGLPFIALAAAPLAGLIVGTIGGRDHWKKPPRDLFARWGRMMRFSTWALFSFFAGAVYTNGMNIITAVFVGAAGSAAFGATRTLVAPIVTLTSASDMIDKPRASRAFLKDGIPGLRRVVRGTLVFLLVLGVPYLILVFAFADELLALFYGQKYMGFGNELRVWVFAMFFQMAANPLATHLIILADSRSVFLACLSGAITTLVIAMIALPLHGGVIAGLVAMAVGRGVNIVILYWMTRSPAPRRPSRQNVADEDDVAVDV